MLCACLRNILEIFYNFYNYNFTIFTINIYNTLQFLQFLCVRKIIPHLSPLLFTAAITISVNFPISFFNCINLFFPCSVLEHNVWSQLFLANKLDIYPVKFHYHFPSIARSFLFPFHFIFFIATYVRSVRTNNSNSIERNQVSSVLSEPSEMLFLDSVSSRSNATRHDDRSCDRSISKHVRASREPAREIQRNPR